MKFESLKIDNVNKLPLGDSAAGKLVKCPNSRIVINTKPTASKFCEILQCNLLCDAETTLCMSEVWMTDKYTVATNICANPSFVYREWRIIGSSMHLYIILCRMYVKMLWCRGNYRLVSAGQKKHVSAWTLIQWNLYITTTLWDIYLLSGAHLGGQGPPRWDPEDRHC